MKCLRDFAYQVHQDTGIFFAFVPGRAIQFNPMALADYLCDRIPGLSVGAAHNWIWTAAFARSERIMVNALRNLLGLLPGGFVEPNWMDEEPR